MAASRRLVLLVVALLALAGCGSDHSDEIRSIERRLQFPDSWERLDRRLEDSGSCGGVDCPGLYLRYDSNGPLQPGEVDAVFSDPEFDIETRAETCIERTDRRGQVPLCSATANIAGWEARATHSGPIEPGLYWVVVELTRR